MIVGIVGGCNRERKDVTMIASLAGQVDGTIMSKAQMINHHLHMDVWL
jgi:hypothetical protein